MKKILVALLSLASTSAFACPNLSGHFVCKDFDSGAEQDIVISQAVANGVTTFKMVMTAEGKVSEIFYVADGQVKNVVREEFSSRTEKSYCRGTELLKEINGVRKDSGETLSALETVGVNAQGNMYDSYVGKQGDKVLNFAEVCMRR